MKFGVSNLAWSQDAEASAFEMLAAHGFTGIEVAPTRIAPWEALNPVTLRAYQDRCHDAGLQISSLQAILFNRPQARLLDDEDAFKALAEHMRHVTGIAAALGAGVAVFGAPKNRLKGDLDQVSADALAAERFRTLGNIAAAGGLILGLEPVPAHYGGDFMLRARDVIAMVTRVGHPNIRAHFDCGCITLGGDAPGRVILDYPSFVHYHASEPDLGAFDALKCDHAGSAAALHTTGYQNWVVIEMRQQGETGLPALGQALSTVAQIYGL